MNNIASAMNKIRTIHGYKLDVTDGKEYWGRVGKLVQRYGGDNVVESIESVPPREITLHHLLNIIERKCQYKVEHGEMDDLASEILNL